MGVDLGVDSGRDFAGEKQYIGETKGQFSGL